MKANKIKKALDTLEKALLDKYDGDIDCNAQLIIKIDGSICLDNSEGWIVCDDQVSEAVAENLEA